MTDGQRRIAYCAPGRKFVTQIALLMQDEHVAEVAEHPWLEGRTDVLVVTPKPFAAGPVEAEIAPRRIRSAPLMTPVFATPIITSLLAGPLC